MTGEVGRQSLARSRGTILLNSLSQQPSSDVDAKVPARTG